MGFRMQFTSYILTIKTKNPDSQLVTILPQNNLKNARIIKKKNGNYELRKKKKKVV